MGFYGNMTNTAHTQFQFDRIYPNRSAMDKGIVTDGIYIGRYVLVEYDESANQALKVAYVRDIDTPSEFYYDLAGTHEIPYNEFVEASSDEVTAHNYMNFYKKVGNFYNVADNYDNSIQYYKIQSGDAVRGVLYGEVVVACSTEGSYTGKYYQCVGDDDGTAMFVEITNEGETDFLINYNIDVAQYGMRNTKGAYSRAWDSTVWQKVFSEGENKYVMIAELNAGAPAISVSFDRPSQTPLPPHVGGMTGENVYDIHLQQPWGFRVAAADNANKSDANTAWVTSHYDENADTITDTIETKPADIYFNKAGFDIAESKHETAIQDTITVRPTGKSGRVYANHKGYIAVFGKVQAGVTYYTYDENTGEYAQLTNLHVGDDLPEKAWIRPVSQPNDINELSIHLPSIGNAVADIYDTAYGVNPTSGKRTRDTAWKYVGEGPDAQLGGMTRDLTTLSGTINTMHDALGMIIQKMTTPYTDAQIQKLDNNKIYYNPSNNGYYYRTKDYEYEPVEYTWEKVDSSNANNYLFNYYYKLPKDTPLTSALIEKFLSLEEQDILDYRDIGGSGFDPAYDYYRRILEVDNFNQYEVPILDYEQNTYYYKEGRNYPIEKLAGFSHERNYYRLKIDPLELKYQPTKDPQPYLLTDKKYYIYDETGSTEEEKYLILNFPQTIHYDAQTGTSTTIPFDGTETWSQFNIYYDDEQAAWINPGDGPIYECAELDLIDTYQAGQYYQYTAGGANWRYVAHVDPNTGKTLLDQRVSTGNPIDDYIITLNENYPQVSGQWYYKLQKDEVNYKELFYPSTFFWFENDDGTVADPMAENAAAAEAWRDAHPYTGLDGFVQPYPIHNSATESNMLSPVEDRYYWRPKSFAAQKPTFVYDEYGNIIGMGYYFSGYERVQNPKAWDYLFIDEHYEDVGNGKTYIHSGPRFYYKIEAENEETYAQITDWATFSNIIAANINAETSGTSLPYRIYTFSGEQAFTAEELYQSSKYYYIDNNGDIKLDTNSTLNQTYQHYSWYEIDDLLNCLEPIIMYEPDKFYYHLNGDVYQIDHSLTVVSNHDYYYRATVRVTDDLFNHFAVGSSWNLNIDLIPCHIELGIPSIHYVLKELYGFLDTESTFFGLILALSQLLDKDNIMTRENDTLRGVINNCIDLNEKFEANVQPNKIVITDNYGKITTGNISIQSLLNRIEALEACCAEIHNGGSSGGDEPGGGDEPSTDDEEELNWLKFSSNSPFTLGAENGKKWDGTIEYSLDNGTTWTTWNGSTITIPTNIQMRGTNNHYISTNGDPANVSTWLLSSNDLINCTGKLGGLLDYATIAANNTVSSQSYAFYEMFANQDDLRTTPSFANIDIKTSDCELMFYNCSHLETLPILPTIGEYDNRCYKEMFKNCSNIKLSATQSNEYLYEYTLNGAAAAAYSDMFTNTGGTFTGTPTSNTTYYTSNQIVQ